MSASLTAGIASLILNIATPLDSDGISPRDDLIGVKVWISTTAVFTPPAEGTLVFDGNNLSVTIPNLTPGTIYYVKYALISDIEPDNYVVSTSYSAVPLVTAYVADASPPPTPTGVVLTPGITSIMIQHDTPVYTEGHGHNRTHVFGVKYTGGALPTFASAVILDQFTGTLSSISSDPAVNWKIWLKWESTDGILSTTAAGGTNGFDVTTGQDVANLLTALSGEITASELSTSLNTRIDLIDGSALVPGSVANLVAVEASARADAISIESNQRVLQVSDAANAALEAAVAAHAAELNVASTVAIARSDLTEYTDAGISAEATSRLLLAAKLDTDIASTLAVVSNETVARVNADAAEASARDTLATQFRGAYTGSDVNAVTSGLIYQERLARSTQDNALSQQITLLSAGAGEQFDWQSIWYFDEGIEGWSGNGTPTYSAGWLRPANQASGAYVNSAIGIAADGNKYNQVRLRIRKTGTPTFAGYLWWRASTDSTWDVSRRIALTEPTYDVNGIGLVTVTPNWTVTVDRIRIDLSSAQTAGDYFEMDWVAIGRPSPGASSAQLIAEQTARIDGDDTLTSDLTTLNNQVNNAITGLPSTRATLINDYYTKTAADTATASAQTSLLANFNTTKNRTFNQTTAPVQTTGTAITLKDGTLYTPRLLYTGDFWIDSDDGNKPYYWTTTNEGTGAGSWSVVSDTAVLSTTAFINAMDTALATSTEATTASWRNAVSKVDVPDGDTVTGWVTTYTTTNATQTTAIANEVKILSASIREIDDSVLVNVLNTYNSSKEFTGTLAVAREDLNAQITEGISAEASARLTLAAIVDENQSFITNNYSTSADTNGSIATAQQTLIAGYTNNKTFRQSSAPAQGSTNTTLADGSSVVKYSINSGDLWYDTSNENTPYVWQNNAWVSVKDAGISIASAKIDTVEQTKIGYCSIGGVATDHISKGTCEIAGGTWNVGLPMATAVKRVQVTDANGGSAVISDAFTTQKSLNDGLKAQKVIKLDVNGHVSGYGVYADSSGGSEFIANVGKFAVTTPDTLIPTRVASSVYALNAIVKIAGQDSKTLVCKQAGTAGAGALDISGDAIGSKKTDGTVIWQVASRVPFSVLSAPTSINGVSVPAGVYIDAAYVLNSTIQNSQIANNAVDNDKILDVNVTKFTAGSLSVGQYIQSDSTYNYGAGLEPIWKINADGNAVFNNAKIRGELLVGSNPIISGTTMTGSGAHIYADGKFAMGDSTRNIVNNGSSIMLNGFFSRQELLIATSLNLHYHTFATILSNVTGFAPNKPATITLQGTVGVQLTSPGVTLNQYLGTTMGLNIIWVNTTTGITESSYYVYFSGAFRQEKFPTPSIFYLYNSSLTAKLPFLPTSSTDMYSLKIYPVALNISDSTGTLFNITDPGSHPQAASFSSSTNAIVEQFIL